MTPRLLLRKKLCKDSKGVYSIIAAVFMVLVVMVLYTNVFVFMLNQNVFFQEAVSKANQEDIDRKNEIITVSNVNYTVEGEEVHVEAIVTNDGPISVQIITLWVFDATIRKYGYNDTLNVNLKTGDILNFSGSNVLIVTIEGSSPSNVFTSWFVTARGNMIPLEEEHAQQDVSGYLEPHPWIDMGKLRFYFDVESLNFTSLDYQDPRPGWVVPGGEDLLFHVKVVNTGETPITVQKDSCLYLSRMKEMAGSSMEAWSFYIVDPDSVHPGQMYAYDEATDPYVIQPNSDGKWHLGGPPVILRFGSLKKADNEPNRFSSDPDNAYVASIGLFYESGNDEYGQNIPFVAIRSINPYP